LILPEEEITIQKSVFVSIDRMACAYAAVRGVPFILDMKTHYILWKPTSVFFSQNGGSTTSTITKRNSKLSLLLKKPSASTKKELSAKKKSASAASPSAEQRRTKKTSASAKRDLAANAAEQRRTERKSLPLHKAAYDSLMKAKLPLDIDINYNTSPDVVLKILLRWCLSNDDMEILNIIESILKDTGYNVELTDYVIGNNLSVLTDNNDEKEIGTICDISKSRFKVIYNYYIPGGSYDIHFDDKIRSFKLNDIKSIFKFSPSRRFSSPLRRSSSPSRRSSSPSRRFSSPLRRSSSPSQRPRSRRTIGGSLSPDSNTDYATNLEKLQSNLRNTTTVLEHFESKLNVFYLIIILEGDENEEDHAILTHFSELLKTIQIEPIRLVKYLLDEYKDTLSIKNLYEIILNMEIVTADYLSTGGISDARYKYLTKLDVGAVTKALKSKALKSKSINEKDITALFR
jgi:hypothetical protein